MPKSLKVKLVVDTSLLAHVKEGLAQQGAVADPEDKILDLLTMILDGSDLPIAAKRTKSGAIRVSYHPRSFSQPLF